MNTGKKGGKKGDKKGGTLTTGKRDLAGTAPVSVLVPTLNEARNLADCLAALAWAGEVVVFDSHSTDSTQQIASNWGARVVERTFSDFASHKNWALETIDFAHDWILIIDADERVTPGLEGEIRTVVARTGDRPGDRPGGPDGYYLARKNIFAGRWIRHAAMYPDHNLRLFRRGRARYEPRIVHEHMICDSETGVLSEPLVHHDYKGIERYIDRHNTYSSLEAVATHIWLDGTREAKDGLKADLFGNGPARRRAIKRFAYRYLPARPAFVFLWMYLFRLGFLDGRIGLRYCLLRFFYELQVDLKLEELRDPASPISEAYGHFLQQDQGEPDQSASLVVGQPISFATTCTTPVSVFQGSGQRRDVATAVCCRQHHAPTRPSSPSFMPDTTILQAPMKAPAMKVHIAECVMPFSHPRLAGSGWPWTAISHFTPGGEAGVCLRSAATRGVIWISIVAPGFRSKAKNRTQSPPQPPAPAVTRSKRSNWTHCPRPSPMTSSCYRKCWNTHPNQLKCSRISIVAFGPAARFGSPARTSGAGLPMFSPGIGSIGMFHFISRISTPMDWRASSRMLASTSLRPIRQHRRFGWRSH